MSLGKDQETISKVEIPEWLEDASKGNIDRAEHGASLGYIPHFGADVAAFNPTQQAWGQSNLNAAAQFGLIPGAQAGGGSKGIGAELTAFGGGPEAETFAGGLKGHSAGGLFDQALAELQARRPGQFDAYQSMFIDPQTGQIPGADAGGQPGFGTGSQDDFKRLVAYGQQMDSNQGDSLGTGFDVMGTWNNYLTTGHLPAHVKAGMEAFTPEYIAGVVPMGRDLYDYMGTLS